MTTHPESSERAVIDEARCRFCAVVVLAVGSGYLAVQHLVQEIYEAHGDRLVICCDEPRKARPVGLTPKGTQWVEWWLLATH